MAHDSLRTHRKLQRLCKRLKIREPEAIGTLQLLWWEAYRTRAIGPDGLLQNWSGVDVASIAKWVRDPEELVEGLLDVGFLDRIGEGLSVHHLANWAPDYVLKRWRRAGWSRDDTTRKWSKNSDRPDKSSRGRTSPAVDGHRPPTQRNATQRNPPREGSGGVRAPPEEKTEIDVALKELAGIRAPSVRCDLIQQGVTIEQIRAAYDQTASASNRGGAIVARLRDTLKGLGAAKATTAAREQREARERAERTKADTDHEAGAADRKRAVAFLKTVSDERKAAAWKALKKSMGAAAKYMDDPNAHSVAVADYVDPKRRT